MAILRYRDGNGNIVPIRVIRGEDGKDGNQMFVRFSAYADGTDMSEDWDASRNYMGIAFGEVAPTDTSGYQWIYITSEAELDKEVAELRKEIATLTITADRVTDLTEFMVDYQTAKIVTGTYAGKGNGFSHTLTFPFEPKFVVITDGASYAFFALGATKGYGGCDAEIEFSQNNLRIGRTNTFSGSADIWDVSGTTYSYVAFG